MKIANMQMAADSGKGLGVGVPAAAGERKQSVAGGLMSTASWLLGSSRGGGDSALKHVRGNAPV